jgi:CheY-like chemotaxis protein
MDEHHGNRPIALLVEDKPDLLKARRNLFNVSGFQAICVRTAAEALREFIATPAVDIIVADINLDPHDEHDVSGVDVAATIREMRPDVPIVAISGQFDSLSKAQTGLFTDSLVKGKSLSIPDYDAKLDKWRGDAIAYRERRTTSSKRALEALEDGESHVIDYQVLREFLPGRKSTSESETPSTSVASADEVLRAAGWWLQLIQAGKTVGSDSTSTRLAVLVWLRKDESDHLAVLHGYSFLACRAPEAGEAVERLLAIMAAYHSGRLHLGSAINEAERQRLARHLNAVFG